MLHFETKKNKFSKTRVFLGAFLLATLSSVGFAQESTSTPPDPQVSPDAIVLQDRISNKNSELEQLKNQIATYQKQVDVAHGETQTLQGAVRTLDIERQKMGTSIRLTENQLETANLTIDELGLKIADTETKMTASETAIAEVMRTTEQAESRTLIETLLSKSNISDILDESAQLGQLRDKISGYVDKLKKFKEDLIAQKNAQETEKKKIIGYKAQLVDKKVVLDNTQKEKKSLLSVTKNKESNYQKILNENLAKKAAFEKELFDYEAQLKRELDKKYIPTAGSKILYWPLDKVRITQHFGRTADSARLYASGTHNGIDFAASRGTPVKSAASGTVIGNGNTDITCPKSSYGKWVLIRHNNGLATLYGHLDLIKVSNGQDVSAGDIIGYSGNTGYATGPHLHFTVFASDGVQVGSFASKACSGRTYTMPLPTAQNAYLDPEAYL